MCRSRHGFLLLYLFPDKGIRYLTILCCNRLSDGLGGNLRKVEWSADGKFLYIIEHELGIIIVMEQNGETFTIIQEKALRAPSLPPFPPTRKASSQYPTPLT